MKESYTIWETHELAYDYAMALTKARTKEQYNEITAAFYYLFNHLVVTPAPQKKVKGSLARLAGRLR